MKRSTWVRSPNRRIGSILPPPLSAGPFTAGRHQRAVERFVARESKQLAARPAAFFSVSLSAASNDPEKSAAARKIAQSFVAGAGWSPQWQTCFAGKLAYSQYGFFKRWIMRRIARAEGQPTDTSRDYDYTNWPAVRDFALAIASNLQRGANSSPSPPVVAGVSG